jgi:glutamate racemase
MTSNNKTIGVFDSGFGGLTVLRALLPLIPGARYIYLGDTARLPYGSKSRETIARYAVSSAKFLHDQGADLLVIACNTATALALKDIQQALPIPVIGVVEPGAQAALQSKPHFQGTSFRPKRSEVEKSASLPPPIAPPISPEPLFPKPHFQGASFRPKRSEVEKSASLPLPIGPPISPESLQTPGAPEPALSLSKGPDSGTWVEPPPTSTQAQVLVLATAATVQSHAYTRALNALHLEAHEKACPLLVPLVEEGWINHPVTDEVLRIYLTEALAQAPATTTLLLGCTHYPLLEPAIRRTLASIHHPLTIIDSAEATARAVAAHLGLPSQNSKLNAQSSECIFYATDSVEKFQHLGSTFLGQPVAQVNLIDLGG